MDMKHPPAVLSIAGSDSSGGAGIQADIKTVTAHRLYGEGVVTAVMAENTQGVRSVMEIDPKIIADQIDACYEDIRPAAVRIGVIHAASAVDAITERLSHWNADNVVVDPVIYTTSGHRLIDDDTMLALERKLFPLATVITPSRMEAQTILDYEIDSERTQQSAAMLLVKRFGCAAVVKGGELDEESNDVLAEPSPAGPDGRALSDPLTTWYHHKRIDTANTHGAGATFSTAIACGLAEGMALPDAVNSAKAYVTGALAAGLDLGKGSGPLNHMWHY